MNYYAVFDTNVLVSALLNDRSVPGQVFAEVTNGSIIPLYSSGILAEYEDVLHRNKFQFTENEVRGTINSIIGKGIKLDPRIGRASLPDEEDVVFYAVVMEKREDTADDADAYLITGNLKHFPKEPFIVTPREMLDIIRGQANREKNT